MRLTITSKIALGLAVIVALGVASMAIIASGLRTVGRNLEELTDDKEPRSAAVYEMEINVNGFGLAVLKYQHHADPRFRAWAHKDENDFARFHALFMTLADTPEEWHLGAQVGQLFAKYRRVGRALLQARDRQEALFAEMFSNFEGMDELIDREIQPRVGGRSLRNVAQLEAILDLEADVAEIGLWLANFQRARSTEAERLVRRHEEEFRATLARFLALPATPATSRASQELGRLFDYTMGLVHSAITIEKGIHRRSLALIGLREEIDRLLDTELQILSALNLSMPRQAAAAATRRVIATVWVLIPLFLLSAVSVGFVLRAMLRPLSALTRGTKTVGRGDLRHRIVVRGSDELTDLARSFNAMVADLEATTVSKARLEENERVLADTVVALRHEVAERERAGEERARLEVSLRRSEVMAVMGALVAGVAHEVRNPLFGISSVVDALEARLEQNGQRSAIETHLGVLRGEVDRLSRLMVDLLEFGRPSSGELVDAPLAEVVSEAVSICAPLAERAGVAIRSELGDLPCRMAMSRERLVQVFRNVIENAIHHSPRGGVVRVETRNGDQWVEYVISDSGGGIGAEHLPRIFEPFFSRRHAGTGLGLSIVQRIVEEHHGTVAAENSREGGAVFVIRLPVAAVVSRHAGARGSESGPMP